MVAVVTVVAAGLAQPGAARRAVADELARDFAGCRSIADGEARLACYDKLATKVVPPRFAGRLTVETEPFTIDRPTVLRYQSDGPIFVMYLRDANNNTVQNLHIGGGGEDTYVIEKPGVYSLHINGAETWRVWLDPKS